MNLAKRILLVPVVLGMSLAGFTACSGDDDGMLLLPLVGGLPPQAAGEVGTGTSEPDIDLVSGPDEGDGTDTLAGGESASESGSESSGESGEDAGDSGASAATGDSGDGAVASASNENASGGDSGESSGTSDGSDAGSTSVASGNGSGGDDANSSGSDSEDSTGTGDGGDSSASSGTGDGSDSASSGTSGSGDAGDSAAACEDRTLTLDSTQGEWFNTPMSVLAGNGKNAGKGGNDKTDGIHAYNANQKLLLTVNNHCAAGPVRIKVMARNVHGPLPGGYEYFEMQIQDNQTGEALGTLFVPASDEGYRVAFATVNLAAGSNVLNLLWLNDNGADGTSDTNLHIKKIQVQSSQGDGLAAYLAGAIRNNPGTLALQVGLALVALAALLALRMLRRRREQNAN